jgi:hypothetical protein
MVKRWIQRLVRRRRIARYRRREIDRELQDERKADHVERAREGIKDIPGPNPFGT